MFEPPCRLSTIMLEVKELQFSFNQKALFQSLSFEIKKGDLLHVVGPNGAGKSTLIALLTGQLQGASGSVSYQGGLDFRAWTSWLAPDGNGHFFSMSALQNLRYWVGFRRSSVSDQEIQKALEHWGIPGPWLQQQLPVGKFSTGMKRRLSLARIQLEQSKLWLLDEPLFGLDDRACQLFTEMLSAHINAGGAAIIVTHDSRCLAQLSHKRLNIGKREP